MFVVYCELQGGQIRKASLEALSEARRLAGDKPVNALFVGADCKGAEKAGAYGADEIWLAQGPHLAAYSSDLFATAVAEALKAKGGKVLLGAATPAGKDMLPRVAARLKAGYLSEVTALNWAGNKLQAVRPVYAGKALATVEAQTEVQIISTRPNVFTPAECAKAGTVVQLNPTPAQPKAAVKEVLAKGTGKQDLTEADIIVAGGRGMKEGAQFKLLEALADALGGVVGASRAAVDAGWDIPHSMQIGQTGKVVSPSLYIACGISGAIQHLAGMSGSKVIVAINKDPEAPIFKLATYGIVGDVMEVLPALTQAVKA